MEFYLLEGRAVEILITSLTGKGSRIARIVPEELQEGITRLRIQVEMKDETHLQVELEDLGFGQLPNSYASYLEGRNRVVDLPGAEKMRMKKNEGKSVCRRILRECI